MRLKQLSIVAAAAAAFAVPATAKTINNVAGIYDESGASRSNAPIGAVKWRDFDETNGDPLLEIVGDTHIFGFVAHRANFSGSLFTDRWAMNFGTDTYNVVFRWEAFGGSPVEFDGRFGVNGVYTDLGLGGELVLGNLTGLVEFDLDPIFGIYKSSNDEKATWDIEALQVNSVPLPAGGLLLLSGLAGVAALRRRKTKSA